VGTGAVTASAAGTAGQLTQATPAMNASARSPATPAGAQAVWLLAALGHLPIPTASVEAHFASTFLAKVTPTEINAEAKEIGPLSLVPITSSQRGQVIFVRATSGSVKLEVSLQVDGQRRIDQLLVQPAAATSTPGVSGTACLSPSSAQAIVCYRPVAFRSAFGIESLVKRGPGRQGPNG
jgi:ORF 12 gene product N-terminal